MAIKSDPSTWTDPRHQRGLRGEEIALSFLRRRGWEILAHRFRLGRVEVDIIARRARVIAFIEVKTRGSVAFGRPIEAVGAGKQRDITRVARAWIDRYGAPDLTYRLDVIGVTLGSGRPRITHVEGAFRAGWR